MHNKPDCHTNIEERDHLHSLR